jgi:hypothetical protein
MNKLASVAIALAFLSVPALADSDWGCSGGTFEKETEASSYFEADDVKCKDGNQYDVKLDGSFKVISITRD